MAEINEDTNTLVDTPDDLVAVSVDDTQPDDEVKDDIPSGLKVSPYSLVEPPRPLELSVTNTRNVEAKTPFTVYVILVKWPNGKAWVVSHRFSEFEAMHKKLSQRVSTLPSLPAKTWFRSLASDFISKRRTDLHDYLQVLLKSNAVVQSPEFRKFLDIDKNVVVPDDHVPALIETLSDENFGVSDFLFDQQIPVIFTACEECHTLNRIDAQLSNLRFPWEEKGIIAPLGSFNVWLLQDNKWDAVNNEYYDTECTCLAWDRLRGYVFLGQGNGHVLVYLIDIDNQKISQVTDLEVHAARVTSVAYDKKKDTLITASRDKSMCVIDVKNNALLTTVDYGKAWISCMVVESDQSLGYLGTYSRTVELYDLESNPPYHLHTLGGHKGSVRCLHFDKKQRYLFSGGFGHSVGIWSIAKTKGNANRSRSVGWLAGGPPSKVKAVTFASELNYVIAGHEGGNLAVWDVMNAKLLYVFDAHTSDIMRLVWIDGQRTLMSGSLDGTIKLWRFPAKQ